MFPFCNLFGHQAGQASAKPAMQGSVITKLKAIHAGPDGIVVSRHFRILLFVGLNRLFEFRSDPSCANQSSSEKKTEIVLFALR